MVDVKETKELVAFLAKLGQAVKKSLEDGKFALPDAFNFVGPMMAASAAISEAGEIPEELKDLSAAEALELMEVVAKEMPELQPKVLEIVKASIKLLVAGVELFKAVKG